MEVIHTVLILLSSIDVCLDPFGLIVKTGPIFIRFFVQRFLLFKDSIQVLLFLILKECRLFGILCSVKHCETSVLGLCYSGELFSKFLTGLERTTATSTDMLPGHWGSVSILNHAIVITITVRKYFDVLGSIKSHCLKVSQVFISIVLSKSFNGSVVRNFPVWQL